MYNFFFQSLNLDPKVIDQGFCELWFGLYLKKKKKKKGFFWSDQENMHMTLFCFWPEAWSQGANDQRNVTLDQWEVWAWDQL